MKIVHGLLQQVPSKGPLEMLHLIIPVFGALSLWCSRNSVNHWQIPMQCILRGLSSC